MCRHGKTPNLEIRASCEMIGLGDSTQVHVIVIYKSKGACCETLGHATHNLGHTSAYMGNPNDNRSDQKLAIW